MRLSDFKTNEYANLVGGAAYEPKEENPMIGWRGASRYYDGKYKAGFALECKALKKSLYTPKANNTEGARKEDIPSSHKFSPFARFVH